MEVKMKMSLCYTVSVILLFLILFGCSFSSDQPQRRSATGTRDILSLKLPYTPARVAYSSLDNSLFIMEPESNLIHIFQNGVRINTIGGLGFGESNFNRLSDITVSPHGRLLALDSFQKVIKKFDGNGMWLENYPVTQLNEPLLFDVAHDGTVFIYDRTSNEIVIYDEKIEEITYRFGKFLLRDPILLSSTFTHVTVYNRGSNKSFIFDTYGRLTDTLICFWQTDRFNNRFLLNLNRISLYQSSAFIQSRGETKIRDGITAEREFHVSAAPWQSFIVKRGIITLIAQNGIQISELVY